MKKWLCIVLCLLSLSGLEAQDILAISGKIVEKSSGNPIPFANISVTNTMTGTISNEDGNFTLMIPGGNGNIFITISHIGYATVQFSADQIISAKGDVRLDLSPKVLDEVVVKPLDPVSIVRQAMAAVSGNYSQSPVGMSGFYREVIRENGKPLQLAESLLGVYYSSYNGPKGDVAIKFLKGRQAGDPDTSHFYKSGHNLGNILQSIFANDLTHSGAAFDYDNFITNSDMKVVDILDYDSTQVYEIKFDQKDGIQKSLYKGTIFIDTKSLAIVCLDFMRSPKGLPYYPMNKKVSLKPGEDGQIFSLDKAHWVLNYKRKGSTWYLGSAIGSFQISYSSVSSKKPDMNFNLRLNVDNAFLVTGLDPAMARPFSKKEGSIGNGTVFEKIKDLDPQYWEHNNYIVPSMDIRSIADSLKSGQR